MTTSSKQATGGNRAALQRTLRGTRQKAQSFMFMGTATSETGQSVYLYKHEETRRYLNCDLQGNCYQAVTSLAHNGQPLGIQYFPQGREAAITHAFS